MGGIDGLEALKRIRELDPAAIVVMISGHGTIQTAVEATQLGAYDFLEKPLDTDRILVTLRNALQHVVLREENARLRAEHRVAPRDRRASRPRSDRSSRRSSAWPPRPRACSSPARTARARSSSRARCTACRRARDKPFVEVNCAAIPSELIESELFGHMKGSFTGAIADRTGKFEQADGGTLFLDEIGDMSLSAQAKVLRVLEDGVVNAHRRRQDRSPWTCA